MSVDEPPQDAEGVISQEDAQEDSGKSYQELVQDKQWADWEAKQKADEEEPLEETDDPDDGQDDDDTSADEPIGDDPGVPEVIMQAALAQGFSAQDVQSLGAARTAELVMQRNLVAKRSQQQTEAPEGKDKQGDASEETGFQFEEIKLENPDDYDESTLEVIKHVNAMGKALQEQHAKMTPMVSHFSQWQQAQQMEQAAKTSEMFDGFFSEANKQHGDIFGEGNWQTVSEEDFAKRNKVVTTAMAIHQANPGMDIKDAFTQSVLANHADVISERKAEQLRESVKKQSGKRVGAANGKRKTQRPDFDSLPPDHPDVIKYWERKFAEAEA
ncbi:hypothetical protein [Bremerella sp. P1]|uniref:hypothetical protein n=1 Tax=Bremerella sp. P1 TaxID=3026424 RepID=UPI0023688841|nr:hypothetical protein [Bremerella sp. P1]WDI44780.1 hypothetical protein PSR63_12620 [Bremerella sp. P1]